MAVIDHIVIAAGNLSEGVAWFTEVTGVEPTPGGAHPGVGTRNALVSLGERTYIELIAPDPEQPEPANPRPFGIDDLASSPKLATYAVCPDDIDDAAARLAAEADLDLGPVSSMSRRTPEGGELAWRLTRSPYPDGGGVLPFLIEWGDTPHPAGSAVKGCTLSSFAIQHPEPDRVKTVLDILDLDVAVDEATEPKLFVTLDTPRGAVGLG